MNLSNIITAILTDPDVLKPIVEAVRKELVAEEPPATSFYQRVVALERAVTGMEIHARNIVDLDQYIRDTIEEGVARKSILNMIDARIPKFHSDKEIAASQVEGLDDYIRDYLEQDGVKAENVNGLDRIIKAEVDNIEVRADDIAGMEQAIKDALEDITFKLTVD